MCGSGTDFAAASIPDFHPSQGESMSTTSLISPTQLMIREFHEETAATKRILERVPADKLTWKPHSKSMSLGQLALHIARIPNRIAGILQADHFDVSQTNFNPPGPANLEEVHAAFAESIRAAEACLTNLTEESASENWRLMAGPKEIFAKPRVAVIRTMMLNHWYHHRGQLTVYLRLLDVPLPVIYGRTADENPFA
jgi:uncharacterized damage-inducible protein DinB